MKAEWGRVEEEGRLRDHLFQPPGPHGEAHGGLACSTKQQRPHLVLARGALCWLPALSRAWNELL